MPAALPDPLMLRVYKDDKKGATAFFRNRAFLGKIVSLLQTLPAPHVFFHACSVGAEPYSFAATALDAGLDVAIDATDIEPDFVAAARRGSYPATITTGMTDEEKHWFQPSGDKMIVIDDVLRGQVNFLPSQSVLDPLARAYDAVFAMNVLTYLTPDAQSVAIKTMAKKAKTYLCLTAFHPDTIRADIEAAGFEPVMDQQQAIHDAWGDRIKISGITDENKSWAVPPYNKDSDDYAYRYGAIFKRK